MSQDLSFFMPAEQLARRLNDQNLVIVDCRFRLTDPAWGERQYQQGHIPGAFYLHLDRDLSAPIAEHGGRHPLPEPEQFVKILSNLGIERGITEVVIYDDFRFAFAARFWWLLKYYGHDRACLLDGGWQAWQAGHYPVSSDRPLYRPGSFQAQMRPHYLSQRHELLIATNAQRVILDARDGDRYRGEREPLDPIAGHIPGARNAPWKEVSTESGYVESLEQQKTHWQPYQDATEIVLYCGSGVTACVNWLSLEMVGMRNLKLYAGGWSDWCSYLPRVAKPDSP